MRFYRYIIIIDIDKISLYLFFCKDKSKSTNILSPSQRKQDATLIFWNVEKKKGIFDKFAYFFTGFFF